MLTTSAGQQPVPRAAPGSLTTVETAQDVRAWASPRLLRRLVNERRIPFHKVGGRIYFLVEDLDSYFARARVEAS